MRFEFREGFFDRIEVGTIRRQIKQAGARCLDHRTDGGPFVARQIVHHDDVARLEFGDKNLFDIDLKSVPINGTVEDEGRRDAADPKTGDKGRRLPVSVRDAGAQPLPARAAPCVRAMFVEVQVSSMKTRRSESRSSWPSNQSSRRFRTSGRSCSLACAVFFCASAYGACRSATARRRSQWRPTVPAALSAPAA